MGRWHRAMHLIAAVGLACSLHSVAIAQPSLDPDRPAPASAPEPLPAVLRVIELPYLSADQRRVRPPGVR